jgi:hypothetical protein
MFKIGYKYKNTKHKYILTQQLYKYLYIYIFNIIFYIYF